MRTPKSEAAAAASIGVRTAGRKRDELLGALHSCFARGEVFTQAGKYVNALMSDLKDRNGWAIAKFVGDRTPDKTQRLLGRAVWDTAAAMSVVRRFAASGLESAARKQGRRKGRLTVLALDETGQEKKGT